MCVRMCYQQQNGILCTIIQYYVLTVSELILHLLFLSFIGVGYETLDPKAAWIHLKWLMIAASLKIHWNCAVQEIININSLDI